MATVTGQSIRALINQVERTEGFRVTDLGLRWKIINDDGGRQVFISKRPPLNNTMKPLTDALASIGWEETLVEEAKQNGRAQRLAADRERNEARLQAAIEEANRIAEEEKRQESNRSNAKALSLTATDIGYGHRKAVMAIDVDFARALLEHNNFFAIGRRADAAVGRCNRPFSNRLRDYFVGQILRNNMKLTHQGIALDTEGVLLDGQHRLAALIKAAETKPDATFLSEITYDLDPDTMLVIDSGKGRLKTDHLAWRGFANRHLLASTVGLVWHYDNFPLAEWDKRPLSTDQMFEFIDNNPGIIDAVRRGGNLRHLTTGSSAAAFLYVAERVYRDAPTEDFVHGFRNTYLLEETDPRVALRKFNDRIRHGVTRRRTDQVEQFALLIKTWNKYLTGETWKTASWKLTEDFPRPIERD